MDDNDKHLYEVIYNLTSAERIRHRKELLKIRKESEQTLKILKNLDGMEKRSKMISGYRDNKMDWSDMNNVWVPEDMK